MLKSLRITDPRNNLNKFNIYKINKIASLDAQRLVRRVEDQEVPGSSPTQD